MSSLKTMVGRGSGLRKVLQISQMSAGKIPVSTTSAPEKDAKAALFFNPEVQGLMRRLTGMDYQKVFRVAKLGQKIEAPTYAFLTEKELNELQEKARKEALRRLQFPPVMSERKTETKVLEVDEAIQGYDASKLVFTDITYGVHDRDRIIVVREPDGTLRGAEPTERDRLNQIYFPKDYRKIYTPPMFEPEQLKEILKPESYLYVLDRNCCQFEPDHPTYIRTAAIVFDHIDGQGHYEVLWSTRHYGPLVFHLAWERKCDDLITHYLTKNQMEAVEDTVRLYALLQKDSGTAEFLAGAEDVDGEKLLRQFINKDSCKPTKLTAALESMLERQRENQKINENLDAAHNS